MRTLSLRVLACLFLMAASLTAQGRDLPSRQQPKPQPKNGSRLDLPTGGEQTQGEQEPSDPAVVQPEASDSGFWGEPKNRAEELFLAFERLDSTRKLTRKDSADALLALQGLGLRTRTTALKALESPHVPTVGLAAELLKSVGDMEGDDARILVETASGVGDVIAAGACLDAALILNGGVLPARAVALISHPRRQLRTLAEGRLKERQDPSFLPGLLKALQFGRDHDIRLRATRLLTPYRTADEVRQALRQALADDSVLVAFAAADALAGTSDADRSFLRQEFLATTDEGERGYLAYALLQQQQVLGELLVDPALAAELRLVLGSENIFLSGAAAALLGEFVFRSDVDENLSEYERAVPFALVRSVAGTDFYPQFSRFAPLAEQCLNRIAGLEPGPRERRAWLDWYAQNRETFHFVRGNLLLAAEDLPRLQIVWSQPDQPPRALAGIQAVSNPENTRLLGTRALTTLVSELQQTPVLDLEVLPGTYGSDAAPLSAAIEVRVGPRRKPVRFRGNAGASWLPQVLASLNSQFQRQGWQKLAAGDPEFLRAHLEEWDQATAADQPALMATLSVGRISVLPADALADWCQQLLATEGVADHWTSALRTQLLDRIDDVGDRPEIATLLVRTALMDGATEATLSFLDRVAHLEEPLASDLLLTGLRQLGAEASRIALADDRVGVKVAALRSLADQGRAATPTLLQVLEDGDPLLVRVALGALGQIGDPAALDAVLPWASPGAPKEIRKEALLTLGALGDDQVLDAILPACASEDFGIRLAAIGALRLIPGQAADAAFQQVLPEFVGSRLEASFAFALQKRGARLARTVYRSHFSNPQPGIARRAHLLAARLGEPEAAAGLIAYLTAHPNDAELLDALATSTCMDFRTMPDPAGVYTVWWRDHSREDPSLWLVDGVRGLGFPLEEHFVDGSGASLEDIVEDLLEVLADGPSHLRPASALYLTRFTGIDAPAIAPAMPPALVRELAKPWREWLAAQRAADPGDASSR